MTQHTLIDAERLRAEVRERYGAVAVEPAARSAPSTAWPAASSPAPRVRWKALQTLAAWR